MTSDQKILELKKALEEYEKMKQKDQEFIDEGYKKKSPCMAILTEKVGLKWNEEAHKFIDKIRTIIS